MAVTAINNPSSLKLKFSLGMVDGKEKRRVKSYSHLKHNAGAQDVYDVAVRLASLQDHILMDVCKADNTSIAQ